MAGRRSIVTLASASALLAMGAGPHPLTASVEASASPSAAARATAQPARPPAGWLVMERFGQAPDGSTTELDFSRRQIWLVRPDGTELHELAPGLPSAGKVSPDVSPDGTRIAFSSWDPSQVYEVGLDAAEPRLLTNDCSGVWPECQEYDPAYSPDGTRMAVGRVETIDGAMWSWIAIRDLDSVERIDLETTRVGPDRGWVAQPAWSPDGTAIAYHLTPLITDGYPSGITGWIVSAAGGDPVRLPTPDGEDAADLDWSPDGERIVYSTIGAREFEGQSTEPARIVSIEADGSDAIVLCDDRRIADDGCWAPTWTPDGQRVLFYGYRTWNTVAADGTNNAPIDPLDLTWFGDGPGEGYGYYAIWLPS